MINTASSWIDTQQLQQRKIILVIDSCSETNPILEFFKSGITSLKNFICLYKETELEKSIENSPWLVELNNDFSINQINHLLETPETNWGWLASMDSSFTLEQLAKHWQQRMIIEGGNNKFIYRFQDNRTISWHLQNLSELDKPLLLGPIDSVLAWDEKEWKTFNNQQAELQTSLLKKPWQDIKEPKHIGQAIRSENMKNWLFESYPKTLYDYSEIEDFYTWVDEQLIKADDWGWDKKEQWQFLLGQQLDPKQRISTDWFPINEETPEQHYQRCKAIFNKPLDYIETYIDTEKL